MDRHFLDRFALFLIANSSQRIYIDCMTASQHEKHPDWDLLCSLLFFHCKPAWFYKYLKSHDINKCTDEQGNTLLHYAVQRGNTDVIFYLSHLLIDPNIKNAAGQTALQLARDTHVRCFKCLQKYHLCIDFDKASSEPNGLDALFAAIYRGDATLGDLSRFKHHDYDDYDDDYDDDDDDDKKNTRQTALYFAAQYDRPHLIRELYPLFLNSDLDYSPRLLFTALRTAIKHGHSNSIIALCECFPTMDGCGTLSVAMRYNRPNCIITLHECFSHLTESQLEGSCSYFSALMCGATFNNPDCIRVLHLCFPNIDPNEQHSSGITALIAAIRYATSPDCIQVLAECFPNIDPNKQDHDGNSALMYIIAQNWTDSVALFSSCFPNTDVNMHNKEGKTALMMAIDQNDHANCIIALHESFPDIEPNRKDKHGNTALMLAACKGQSGPPIISQLLQLFPNIDSNAQNDNQDTALMLMLKSPYCPVESIRYFLHTVDFQNAQGENALALAIKQGNNISLGTERINNSQPSPNQTIEHQLDVISVLLEHISQIA